MYQKIILIILLSLLLSCSKDKEIEYETKKAGDPFELYQLAYNGFVRGDYFYASKKFSEAELSFQTVEYSAKAAIMSSYSLYGINFYTEALENLERFLKKYPADSNVMYAHYLIAIIHFEQM